MTTLKTLIISAIIILKKPDDTIDSTDSPVETDGRPSLREYNGRPSLQQRKNDDRGNDILANNTKNQPNFIRLPKSISSFIAGFKSAINSKIDDYIDENNLDIPKYNRNNHFFQPNYYDHIIRNNDEFKRIKNYIINNPQNWETDTLKG